jgi:hypothetical protein
MPTHHRFWSDQQERFLPPRPQLSESDPKHLVDRAQSPPRSFGMESQQLLTQCKVLQNEVFAGLTSSDEPTDKVSKQRNHGKNLS